MADAIQRARQLAQQGRREDAIAELERAVAATPGARDAALMLARLANEQGRYALAETQAHALTVRNPGDAEAWSALGFALSSQGRPAAARDALEAAVRLQPSYATAYRKLAAVLCDQELAEEALTATESAQRHGDQGVALRRIRARALLQLDRVDEAESVLREVLRTNAADVPALRLLSQLRQLRGDGDPLLELRTAAAPGAAPALRLAYADLARRTGALDAAHEVLHSLLAELGRSPALLASLATLWQERGDFQQALECSREALRAEPDSLAIAESFAVSCIGAGVPGEALAVIERMRLRWPRDQRWVTYRLDVARLRGEREFDAWMDPARVTRTFSWPENTPDSIDALRRLLEARHRHRGHPFDHSIRQGTQTARNLLVRPAPELLRLFEWFEQCMREYLAELPPAHPLLSRAASAPRLMGCWSVKLGRAGHHVNHIHPEGWLSSAFYVQVPAECADAARRAGWLTFGEPRFPVPALPPLGFVRPRPGLLVLFPSYLWHGTTPLAGDEPRLTVAFDALPAAEMG